MRNCCCASFHLTSTTATCTPAVGIGAATTAATTDADILYFICSSIPTRCRSKCTITGKSVNRFTAIVTDSATSCFFSCCDCSDLISNNNYTVTTITTSSWSSWWVMCCCTTATATKSRCSRFTSSIRFITVSTYTTASTATAIFWSRWRK